MDRINFKIVAAGILGLILLLPYQNCSDVGFDQTRVDSLEDQQDHEGYLTKRQTEVINSDNSKIDILFVVDNSGSMVKYQNNMAARISGFMDYVRDLDYQIAVTSTDVKKETEYSKGKFRSFVPGGGEAPFKILDRKGTPNAAEADDLLGKAIQMGSNGDHNERGINATYLALNRAENSDFFREDSKLAVVLISDEDECSTGNCSDDYDKPEKLVEFVNQKFGAGKVFTFHSIIHPKNEMPGECPDKHSESRFGKTYFDMSALTQGVVGSVCESNYANQLDEIGKGTESLLRTVQLQCAPQDVNNDGKADVVIYRNGTKISDAYTIKGSKLTFVNAVTTGEYVFDYYCLK
jgi:hypothetical protein